MEAAKHPRQSERLKDLYALDILDTEREAEFDEVVELAAEICGTAISVVNLIDSERQWFKAEVGLGVRETPLATSLCSHVILEEDFVEIEDTLLDPRMVDNPLCCAEPGLRFYAGALLRSENGLPLGTLCVLDYEPRKLNDLQRKSLKVLAGQVMARFNLRAALRSAEVMRQEVDHRVKNSLQLVAALARISARATDDENSRASIEDMERRISTIARVHEQFYQSGKGVGIALRAYIENLAADLQTLAPEGVVIETDIEDVEIGSSEAGSIGLLINEFISNSYKYAFPDGREGLISICGKLMDDGRVSLGIADNGVGFGDEIKSSKGLGMKIAETACMQLDCNLDLKTSATGVSASINFRTLNGPSGHTG